MKINEGIKQPYHAEWCGTVVLLPGRDTDPGKFGWHYIVNAELEKTLYAIYHPEDEWYPIPNGATDQTRALEGLEISVPALDRKITELQERFKIERSKIALVGYSAGAVMAIQLASRSQEPFAAVVSHAGAILDPYSLRACDHPDMPFLLIHSQNDDCFDWHERYLPMKKALREQGYNVSCIEKEYGGHGVSATDIAQAAIFLAARFGGYTNWKHSSEDCSDSSSTVPSKL